MKKSKKSIFMSKSKYIFLILSICCVVSLAIINPFATKAETEIVKEEPIIILPDEGSVVSAIYTSSENFENMAIDVDLIVKGKVTDHYLHESGISTYSVVKVNKVIKGEKTKEIYVLQLNDDIILEDGQEYILFLESQGDDYPDEYCISGGTEGAISIDKNQKLTFSSDKMLETYEKNSKTKSKENSLQDTQNTQVQTNEIEILENSISEILDQYDSN